MLVSFAFYLFSAILVLSALMVITARNPVHSVLFLILAFFNAAGLFVILGAEFVAMILVIVYVGAVAVLFLFVVMMLDVDVATVRQGFSKYLPVGALVGLVLFIQLVFVLTATQIDPQALTLPLPIDSESPLTNTAQIGEVLYTRYAYVFQACGLVLLVAMMGAIVLTLRPRTTKSQPLRQNTNDQIERQRSAALRLDSVKSGEGVTL